MFSGICEESYVNNRIPIGQVHKQIGVEPKYYLSALKTVQDILKRVVTSRISYGVMASGVTSALDKLFYLDTGLTIDAYLQSAISEHKRAAEKAQSYAARMEEKVAEIEVLSRTDPLTGLLNRRAFLEELRKELQRAMRHAEPVCLAYWRKRLQDGVRVSKSPTGRFGLLTISLYRPICSH